MISLDYKWYVLRVKSQHEKKVLQHCIFEGIKAYLPLLKSLRVWSDRKKWIDMPMFPGYIFIYSSSREFFRALGHSSVFDCIRFNGLPAIIPSEQIDAVRIIEQQEIKSVSEGECLSCDAYVRIICGPLKGIEGRISRVENRSYFTIDIPGRSIKLSYFSSSLFNN